MEQDIIVADKKYRNRVFIIVIGLIIVLSIIILIGYPALTVTFQKMEPEKAINTLATVVFVLFLIPIPIGFYLLSVSNRILREERFPPEGMKVIHDTIIIRGDKAKLRAYVFLLLAFLIFFISIFCAFSAHIFIKVLITTRSLL
jgi:hypothetical protein